MVLERMRVAAGAAEGPEEHHHPRKAELVAQPQDRLSDVAEILGDQRQVAELALDRSEELGARAGAPVPAPRRRVPLGNGPVGDEAAEVVDATEIDEFERPPEALAPPAEVRRAMDGPLVERVPPALARRAEGVGGRAGDLTAREQLGPGVVIGAAVGDVDRQVADQPDAALARIVPQSPPLPLEPHLSGEGALPGETSPVSGPEGM